MSAHSVAWPDGSVEVAAPPRPPALRAPAIVRLAGGTAAMAQAELRKIRHDPFDILTRAVQPMLWLFIFGTAMAHNHAIAPGGIEYRAYLAPGVMAQGALFVAIFFGLAVVWERDVGQLQRLLATPLPRSAMVLGKATGAAVRSLVQATLLLIVVAIAGVGLRWTVPGVIGALALLALGTASFACLSMLLAACLRTRERFMGIGQLITMPLFFASSALYPLSVMPGWLHVLSRVNPLTYEVEGMRRCLDGTGAHELALDFLFVIGFLVVMAAAATKAYPRAVL
ncbi:MAG TPA: ABC transporter permease [Solirubrobacteraceae bacterium]|nr:ABC transporter permease [Solirubrobacteraceae bacterium]